VILLPDESEKWLKVPSQAGCFYYFGITGYGKTWLAYHHLRQFVEQDARPALILDCMPDRYNLKSLDHVSDPDALFRRVYGEKRHGCYTPRSADEITYIVNGVRAGRRIHFFWDEPAVHFAKRDLPVDIGAFIRGWRQEDDELGHTVQVVSQRPADLADGAWWITYPTVYAFFLERSADRERLRDELSIPLDVLAALEGKKRRPIVRVPEGDAA
jgi:hypothetical protein